ncbi:hypothetical protein AD998_14970 [bacterium 336/3]|nr:hypothetical protein AD998_14970 [bacterium 336/3]
MKNYFNVSAALKLLVFIFIFTNCKKTKNETQPISNEEPTIEIKTLFSNRETIWGMDFLPNGELLFTEKRGKLFRYANDGSITEITGLPAIHTSGQGGLLDIRIHPKYASNGLIYICYASLPIGFNQAQLNLMRFKLDGNTITDAQIIFQTSAGNTWYGHYGSRIEFDKNGFLYLSVGEGGSGSYGGPTATNKNSQDVKSEWGKVHRMKDDGSIPTDNPVLQGNTTATTIFSYGHRNPQGLILNPFTGEIWESEHGPKGGDEINIVRKGKNYGWHLVSNGTNYDNTQISASPLMDGMESPIHTWTPSIGTCGMAFITDNKFKKWKGNLLVSSLASRYLSRCEIKDNQIVQEYKLLENEGRIRNVKQAPDGSIYVSVESPGRIIQIIPK